MRQSWLLMFALAAGCVAVDATEDADLSETEQAVWDGSGEAEGETILVQGGLDPCWAGLCWPTNWPTDPDPGYTGDGGHGGGGVSPGGRTASDDAGGAAEPDPIPAPRECTHEPTWEQCYDCCDWNAANVWGKLCEQIPWRKRHERRRCREDVEKRRSDCYVTCKRPPILTVAP